MFVVSISIKNKIFLQNDVNCFVIRFVYLFLFKDDANNT